MRTGWFLLTPLDYAHAHTVRQALINRPFPPLRTIVYCGAPWAGTLVTEMILTHPHAVPMLRILKNQEYDGVYRDGVNLSPQDNINLFGEQE